MAAILVSVPVCTLEMADQGFQFIFGRLCEEINKRKKK
jgi:hypothetical protein